MPIRAAELGLPLSKPKRKYPNGTVGHKPGALRKTIMRGTLAALALGGAAKGVQAAYDHVSEGSLPGVEVTILPPAKPAFAVEEKIVKATPAETLGLPQEKVDYYKQKISKKSGFEQEHLAMAQKYRGLITQSALEAGISPEAAMGIIAVENGGGEDVTNPITGARGVAQFLAPTARQYGLIVDGNTDDRADPKKSIPAMAQYLKVHKRLFGGNEGIAVWSYHAGAGVVMKALQVYFLDTIGEKIEGNYGQIIISSEIDAYKKREDFEKKVSELITSQNLTVDQLLSNQAVESQVTSKLEDFSASYPYQVAAAAQLLQDRVSP